MSTLPSQRAHSLHSAPELLQRVLDGLGHVVAELLFYADECILYVRWYGHLTSQAVIDVAVSLPWLEQLRPIGLLNDKRDTTNEWDARLWPGLGLNRRHVPAPAACRPSPTCSRPICSLHFKTQS